MLSPSVGKALAGKGRLPPARQEFSRRNSTPYRNDTTGLSRESNVPWTHRSRAVISTESDKLVAANHGIRRQHGGPDASQGGASSRFSYFLTHLDNKATSETCADPFRIILPTFGFFLQDWIGERANSLVLDRAGVTRPSRRPPLSRSPESRRCPRRALPAGGGRTGTGASRARLVGSPRIICPDVIFP